MFVVTARHAVRDFPPNRLLFYPSDKSKQPVRITRWWRVTDDENHEDSSDLLIARVEFGHLPRRIRARASLIHLDPPEAVTWFDDRQNSLFFLCGYPSDRNAADYENEEAYIGQIVLPGMYVGPGHARGTHQLRLQNPLGVDFDGLSGSPVFSLRYEVAATAPPRFCGMVIRGTASSALVHFLEADIILLALKEAVEKTQTGKAEGE